MFCHDLEALALHGTHQPRVGAGLAHGPIQRNAHGPLDVQAGVELPVDPLHDRKLIDASGQLFIRLGIEAGVDQSDCRLARKSGQETLVIFGEGEAIPAIDHLDDTDDFLLSNHGDEHHIAGVKAGLLILPL